MSSHINKSGVIYVCILIAICCVGPVLAEEKAPPPPDPYINAQILVEAFVVLVPTQTLADIGIHPIGQGSDDMTISKLAAFLVNDSAHVISGAKTSVKQNEEGATKEEKTIYYNRIHNNMAIVNKTPVTSVDIEYSPQKFEKHFSISAIIKSNCFISVKYGYRELGVTPDIQHYDPNDASPLGRYEYSWGGRISLLSGQPVIAGAIQNSNSVVFLVLTATTQNMPDAKP
jgi:hypothetical protein